MALLTAISPSDPISRLALEGLYATAPILNDIEFYAKPGSSDLVKIAREGTAQASIFRSLNENNSPTPPTPTETPMAKRIVSFDAQADVTLEDRDEDPETELAYQTRLEAMEAGYILQEKVFEGDNGANGEEFDGYRNLVSATWILPVATNGIVVPVGNSDDVVSAQQAAIEELVKLGERVRGGATHYYMPAFLRIRFLTISKNLGYYRQSKDEVGNVIDLIGNTIVRSAGYKKDGTALLPFTETCGASTNCSSIFAVRWGERVDLSALTSVGCKGRFAGQSGNLLTNNVNMDMTLILQNPTALVQSTGWRLVAA